MRHNDRRHGRAAFTLVELLVVMAIIAVLVSLTAAAVFQFLKKGPELQTSSDITQLSSALGQFTAERKLTYVPSRLVLHENITAYNTSNPVERDSLTFLKGMFSNQLGILNGQAVHLDWNGNGTMDPPVTLEGHACLVFLLGGIPSPNPAGVTGFSSNPRNPTDQRQDRIGPYFNFISNRLRPYGNTGFYVYLDGFGRVPYAFFSSYKTQNGYNRYGSSDCDSLDGTPNNNQPAPYISSAPMTTPVRYHNPKTYQIVSAGADLMFGPGGFWTPDPNFLLSLPAETKDNLTNFHDKQLGTE